MRYRPANAAFVGAGGKTVHRLAVDDQHRHAGARPVGLREGRHAAGRVDVDVAVRHAMADSQALACLQ